MKNGIGDDLKLLVAISSRSGLAQKGNGVREKEGLASRGCSRCLLVALFCLFCQVSICIICGGSVTISLVRAACLGFLLGKVNSLHMFNKKSCWSGTVRCCVVLCCFLLSLFPGKYVLQTSHSHEY